MNIPGVRQLFTPLNYIRIRRGTVKMWYDWYMPTAISGMVVMILISTDWSINTFGSNGLIEQVVELLKMLIGFYIASLAAVSTFPSAVLNQGLAGESATLKSKRRGKEIVIPLSRRRFLSYLFGYLAFMSLVLFISGMAINLLTPLAKVHISSSIIPWVKGVVAFIYLFWVSNILVSTLLGLHYLTDRIHRPVDGNVIKNDDK
ncbi:hypothetical protein [Thalassolituus oleivorans]|uniref:Phage membrane protein n=1 Tax=Thalassolituus oleivorans MIL-1 TaxID=1298593 RepID=M5DNA8_9GAMM|nr:hypothetical protein [Thalassolituus oleivorans]CCU70928.1 phage membrane protein [Thalassolituus oleivorans MIL-1]